MFRIWRHCSRRKKPGNGPGLEGGLVRLRCDGEFAALGFAEPSLGAFGGDLADHGGVDRRVRSLAAGLPEALLDDALNNLLGVQWLAGVGQNLRCGAKAGERVRRCGLQFIALDLGLRLGGLLGFLRHGYVLLLLQFGVNVVRSSSAHKHT